MCETQKTCGERPKRYIRDSKEFERLKDCDETRDEVYRRTR